MPQPSELSAGRLFGAHCHEISTTAKAIATVRADERDAYPACERVSDAKGHARGNAYAARQAGRRSCGSEDGGHRASADGYGP